MLAFSLFAAAGPAIVAAAPQGSPNLGGTVVTHPRNTEVQRFARLPRAGGLFDTTMFASDAEGGGDGSGWREHKGNSPAPERQGRGEHEGGSLPHKPRGLRW